MSDNDTAILAINASRDIKKAAERGILRMIQTVDNLMMEAIGLGVVGVDVEYIPDKSINKKPGRPLLNSVTIKLEDV